MQDYMSLGKEIHLDFTSLQQIVFQKFLLSILFFQTNILQRVVMHVLPDQNNSELLLICFGITFFKFSLTTFLKNILVFICQL